MKLGYTIRPRPANAEHAYPVFVTGLPADWDESATTKDVILEYRPHTGPDPYLLRWAVARSMITTETCLEIISLMTPRQTFIVYFRLQGLTDQQIANRMQLTPAAVRQNLTRLRRKIYEELPHLRLRLIYTYHYRHPLDPRQ